MFLSHPTPYKEAKPPKPALFRVEADFHAKVFFFSLHSKGRAGGAGAEGQGQRRARERAEPETLAKFCSQRLPPVEVSRSRSAARGLSAAHPQ